MLPSLDLTRGITVVAGGSVTAPRQACLTESNHNTGSQPEVSAYIDWCRPGIPAFNTDPAARPR